MIHLCKCIFSHICPVLHNVSYRKSVVFYGKSELYTSCLSHLFLWATDVQSGAVGGVKPPHTHCSSRWCDRRLTTEAESNTHQSELQLREGGGSGMSNSIFSSSPTLVFVSAGFVRAGDLPPPLSFRSLSVSSLLNTNFEIHVDCSETVFWKKQWRVVYCERVCVCVWRHAI